MLKLFTCKEVTHIHSEERELGFYDRLRFKLHLLICDQCRAYVKKISRVTEAIQSTLKKRSESADSSEVESIKKKAMNTFNGGDEDQPGDD